MKVITLSNQKGGVAKTTTCIALATGLYHRGYTVLCVDLDPQSNLSLGVGADVLNMKYTLYDVFKGAASIDDAINHISLGFDLVTGGLMLTTADMEFVTIGREKLLKEALETVQEKYDFCIIDTSPSLGILTANALTASDIVVIPVTADAFAIQGLTQLYDSIQSIRKYSNSDLEIAGLLITRHDERTNISKVLLEDINERAKSMNIPVFSRYIRNGVVIRNSQLMGVDIFTEAPKANVTQDYTVFIDELLERI